MSADPFLARLSETAVLVETELARLLADDCQPGDIARPHRLMAAMRHGTLNGGKRLRPYLLIETARSLDPGIETSNANGLIRAAAALEMVHCYSLVHDDLPAMDDDDLRRGQPTVHRAFDEATAILAGDALLTYAFDILADAGTSPDPAIRLALISGLTRAAGLGGMVGGQMLDLAAEGRQSPDGLPLRLEEAHIRQLQAMKTGALLRYACEAGAILAGSDDRTRQAMAEFGRLVGQAFQIADDLIDLESAPDTAGKATGKDAARGKATLVGLHGTAAAHAELDLLIAAAEDVIADIGIDTGHLIEAARFIATRAF